MATKREKESYRAAFNKIINSYAELKSITGSLSCTGLYQAVGRQGVGKTTFNSSVIRPLPSDFLCEVDKIAKENLNLHEYQTFCSVYHDNIKPDNWRADKHGIQERLGKELIKAKIHPIEQYFKPKDLR